MSTSKRAKERRQKQMQAAAKARKASKAIDNMKLYGTSKKDKFKEYEPNETYRRDSEQPKIASLKTTQCNTARAADKQYTGTFVKGIGTMHKSNAIPVVDDEFMIALSQMRRN